MPPSFGYKINSLVDKRYRLLARLGRGGMGEVYRAADLSSGKIIAVKILFLPAGASAAVQSFQREFTLLSGFRHPNLCEVYDFGRLQDGRAYFTMEYIDGKNIRESAASLAYPEIYPLIVQVCRALEYIHARGLIHYDIKPGNILISGKTAKLMDFGLAGERKISGYFSVKGTIPYIAPEILNGSDVDHRADLYSLGILLHEICTGRTIAIDRKSSFRAFRKKALAGLVAPPSLVTSGIPGELEQILFKLAAVEPSNRYNRANEVIADINHQSAVQFDPETAKTLEGYLLSSKFVGREKEFEILKAAYQAQHPCLILISGEPGIGKSRLLREFRIFVQLQGGCCFTGSSQPDRNYSYHAWQGIFQEIVNRLKSDKQIKLSLAVLHRLFPGLVDNRSVKTLPALASLEPKQDKLRTQEALAEILRNAAGQTGNMAILLEDLHWADPDSVQFLEYLVRGLPGSNIIVCATCRTDADETCQDLAGMRERLKPEDYFTEIGLRQFDETALSSFLDSIITPASNSPEAVRYLSSQTNGNPFFIEEMLRVLLIEKEIAVGEKIDPVIFKCMAIPKRIEDLLLERLEDLDQSARKVLRYSSALHGDFDFELLKGLTSMTDPDLSRTLRQLKQRRIFTEQNHRYQFCHPKIKETIYSSLTINDKKKLNFSIGRHLESSHKGIINQVLNDLAFYFLNSGDYGRGLKYGLRAAARCKVRYANDEAIHLFQGVLNLLSERDFTKCLAVLKSLADVEMQSGRYDEAIEHCRQGIAMRNASNAQRAAFYKMIGAAYSRKGEPRLALENYNQGLELPVNDTKDRLLSKCQIYNGKCSALFQMGDYQGVEDLADINLKLSKHLNTNDRIKILREIYNFLGSIERIRGNYDKSIQYFTKISLLRSSLESDSDIARTFNHIGIAYYQKGHYNKAIHYYRRALKLFEKAGDWKGVGYILLNIAVIYSNQNQNPKAIDSFDKGLAIARKIGDNTAIAAVYHGMGVCCLDPRNYTRAEDYFRKAIKYWEKVGNDNDKAAALQCLGLVHLGKGDYSLAIDDLQSALDVFQKIGDPLRISKTLNTIGSVYCELGIFNKAREYIQESLNTADRANLTAPATESYSHLCAISLLDGAIGEFVECHKLGLKSAHESKSINMSAKNLAFSAEMHYSKGEYSAAILDSERAIALQKELDDRTDYAQAVLIRAKCEAQQGILKRSKATASFKEALMIAEDIRQPELAWKVYYHYGMFLKQENDMAEAIKYLRKSIEVFRDVCEKIKSEEHRKSYLNRPDRKKVFAAIDELEKSNIS